MWNLYLKPIMIYRIIKKYQKHISVYIVIMRIDWPTPAASPIPHLPHPYHLPCFSLPRISHSLSLIYPLSLSYLICPRRERRAAANGCGGRWVLRAVGVAVGGPLDLPSAAGADGWTSCGLEFLVIEFYLSTWFLGNEVLLDFLVIVENESEQRMKMREQLILIDELCTIYTHRIDRIASWRHPFGMVGSPCCNYIFT